jgi:microcystin-dependent protein
MALVKLTQQLMADDASIPTGTIFPYGGETAPAGWLLCDGSIVSRTDYAELFESIGESYGEGNKVSTFGIPDMRGRIPVGLDNMGGTSANRITGEWADVRGGKSGAETETLDTNKIPAHTHGYFRKITTGGSSAGGDPNSITNTTINMDNTGSGMGHNNMQPSLVVNYIIKI